MYIELKLTEKQLHAIQASRLVAAKYLSEEDSNNFRVLDDRIISIMKGKGSKDIDIESAKSFADILEKINDEIETLKAVIESINTDISASLSKQKKGKNNGY
jgi:hypothetical protein